MPIEKKIMLIGIGANYWEFQTNYWKFGNDTQCTVN